MRREESLWIYMCDAIYSKDAEWLGEVLAHLTVCCECMQRLLRAEDDTFGTICHLATELIAESRKTKERCYVKVFCRYRKRYLRDHGEDNTEELWAPCEHAAAYVLRWPYAYDSYAEQYEPHAWDPAV